MIIWLHILSSVRVTAKNLFGGLVHLLDKTRSDRSLLISKRPTQPRRCGSVVMPYAPATIMHYAV